METDPSLKRMAAYAARDLAAWLCAREFTTVEHATPELTNQREKRLVDHVFTAYPATGDPFMFHIEFQGRGGRRPMPLRMLDYIERIATFYKRPVYSAVIYLAGMGADDNGIHRVEDGQGAFSLFWQYRVVRLWQMRPTDIFALRRPTLLPLIGQTRVMAGERAQIAATVQSMVAPLPRTEQIRILEATTELSEDKELVIMLEQLMANSGMPETVGQRREREWREVTAQLRAEQAERAAEQAERAAEQAERAAEQAATLRALETRLGALGDATRSRITHLESDTYAALLEALFTFDTAADLTAWLDTHAAG